MLASIFFALPPTAHLVRLVLAAHIAAGATALLAGLVPMLGRKGGRWHVRGGRVYTGCMVAVAATATLLCVFQPLTLGRLFLTGIAVLSFYLSFTGWRAARRRSGTLAQPDQVLALVSLLVGGLMVGTGLRLHAVLFAFFGGLLALFAGLDAWQSWHPRPAAQAGPWIFRHFIRLGGSYISAVTAFLVVNMDRWLPAAAPDWASLAVWMAPTFVGGFLIGRTVRSYKTRLQAGPSGPARPTAAAVLLVAGALLAGRPAQAQPVPQILVGVITDAAGQDLPYATVGVVGKGIGTVADDQGRFRLALPASVIPTDTLRFALLGYASRQYAARALPVPPRVPLAAATVALPAVTVFARRPDTLRIGNPHHRTNLQTNFALGAKPGMNVGSEIGRVFQLPRGGAWLETFEFVISANDFDTVQFRINVYRLRRGQPAEALMHQPIYRQLTAPGSRRVRAALGPEGLFLTGEVAVAVEWVSHSRRGKALAIPLLMPAFATHLYRFGAANRWKRFPSMSTTMVLTVLKPKD